MSLRNIFSSCNEEIVKNYDYDSEMIIAKNGLENGSYFLYKVEKQMEYGMMSVNGSNKITHMSKQTFDKLKDAGHPVILHEDRHSSDGDSYMFNEKKYKRKDLLLLLKRMKALSKLD